MVIKTAAIILGGGIGRRVGTKRPKQFEEIAGKPVIACALDLFEKIPEIDGIVVVVPPDWVDFTRALLNKSQYRKVLDVVPGGATRQMSTFSGLVLAQRFGGAALKKVVIHDAVRPLTGTDLVLRVLKAVDRTGAATAAYRASDTLLRVEGDVVMEVVDRDPLWNAQTPQAFTPQVIMAAHRQALNAGLTDATDDIQLVLKAGGSAVVVESDSGNMKITYHCDIEMLQKMLAPTE